MSLYTGTPNPVPCLSLSMQAYRNCIFCQKLHIDYAHLLLYVARCKNARIRVFHSEESCPSDMRFQAMQHILEIIGNHYG